VIPNRGLSDVIDEILGGEALDVLQTMTNRRLGPTFDRHSERPPP
jgi:hypothetical protein